MGEALHVGPNDPVPDTIDEDTEVVLTLLPLALALPVAWQHYLRRRMRHPYQTWLEAVFENPPKDWPTVVSFWQRHHYDVLVARWAAVAGADRLVVAVSDQVPTGDRELSPAEAELVRRVNVAFHHRKWPLERYDAVVRRGVQEAIDRRTSPPAGSNIVTPAWAVDHANRIAAADATRIAASGVRVDGDLSLLSNVVVHDDHEPVTADQLTIDDAVSAVVAAVEAVAPAWRP